jgi:hypothetical protein
MACRLHESSTTNPGGKLTMAIELAVEDVRARAYALWNARGRPEGSPDVDWYAAEQLLRAELDSAGNPAGPLAERAYEALDNETENEGDARRDVRPSDMDGAPQRKRKTRRKYAGT